MTDQPYEHIYSGYNRAYRVSITKTVEIAAQHRLPYHKGKCRRPHGHNYRLEFTVRGALIPPPERAHRSDEGMVMDFTELKERLEPTLALLDHYPLNDAEREVLGVPPLGLPNPTAEALACWLLDRLPEVWRVVVWETSTSCATAERVEE